MVDRRGKAVRGKVLIADDEDAIVLGLMRVLYQDNERYDVLVARNGAVAQQVMREQDIDVLVTDVRMPGLSGLDLLCWASAESPSTRVIVITSFDVTKSEERAFELGCLHFVQKPFDLHQMRELIVDTLQQQAEGFGGSLAQLAPADVVQMLCLGRKTTAMRVVEDDRVGMVYFREGDVIHATWDDLSGEEAFYQLINATSGTFGTIPTPESVPQTITVNWQHLLLEGMRLRDERAAGRGPEKKSEAAAAKNQAAPAPPPPPAQVRLRPKRESRSAWPEPEERQPSSGKNDAKASAWKPPPGPRDIAALIDEGFSAMRDGDYATARLRWERVLELEPDNRTVQSNLRRLEEKEDA
jgi:DNA-binding NarL/FixJ family response regulator